MVNANIRLTKMEDVSLLPGIEYSAGESFRDIPHLAWIADDDLMSTEDYIKYIAEGTSWVAEVDQQLVGFVCAESAGEDLHIWLLAVQREWQAKGIGRKLMGTVFDYARRNGYKSVTLTTFREVRWNEPFYRSLGFEVLDQENIDSRLKQILDAEIKHGIPGDLRCAMRFSITGASE
jgi:GNAT superfamily N-acetyltransferase